MRRGSRLSLTSTPTSSSSSTRRRPPPTWPAATVAPRAASAAAPRAPGPLQNDTTITAALRTTGLCAFDLADGATNGQRFRDYVANRLVPVLRPGDVVILDNLQAHKVSGIRERVEAAGARLLYLPPYSPEFNRSNRSSPS